MVRYIAAILDYIAADILKVYMFSTCRYRGVQIHVNETVSTIIALE